MCCKQVVDTVTRQRIDDEHVRRRRIVLGFHIRDLMGGVFDLDEGGCQPHRLTGDARASLRAMKAAGRPQRRPQIP